MKHKIQAAGGIVTNSTGQILFIFRRGKWDLPKGKLDPGETPEVCAIREISEETGLQHLQLGSFINTTHHEYFDTYLQQDVVKECFWYQVKSTSTEKLIPQTEEDITDIQWIDVPMLPKVLNNTFPNIISIVQQWQVIKGG